MDFQDFLAETSKKRQHSAIRALQKYTNMKDIVNLGGGMPHSETFPLKGITLHLDYGDLEMDKGDLDKGIQYGESGGEQNLKAWLRKLQDHVHKPVYKDYQICIGNGVSDVLAKAFEAVLNPGDTVLIESPTYVGAISFLRPLGLQFLPINVDQHGTNVDELETVLKNWNGKKPKVFYTVPIGGNPTGISITFERKKQVYRLAQKYNFLIFEFNSWIPSYWSMDTDGRVLRFDSFSKLFGGGFRIGWVSAAPAFVERILLHGMVTDLHPSGLSQQIIYTIIKSWGIEGFIQHTKRITQYYKKRRDILQSALEKHLTGLASWNIPDAGLFFWIKLNNVPDTFDLINKKAVDSKVVLLPGVEFLPLRGNSSFVRAAFSFAHPDHLELGAERLGKLLSNKAKL
ncbi:hypothetical protein HDV04_004425 [Boothiomyces sp. JEL0838]|nr:hypothetical protein HDV04_004425 [Boothiomyces sp. JEL0838]